MTSQTLRLPGALPLGLARGGVELRTFFRQRDSVAFTFAMPSMILLVLGSIFTRQLPNSSVTVSQLFAAGMLAGGIASTSFVNLGIGVATDRDDGTIKRLRGTPMPPVAYFLGKIILVLVASLASAALMLTVGYLVFDLALPTELDRWVTFGWVFLLGVTACSLLGIAATNLARSARSAPAVMNLPFLMLEFISGIFVVPISGLPHWMVQIASLFPLKWMAQGFRSVMLPDSMAYQEVAGSWEHGRVALVLAAWCIGGLVLCLTTFRWRGRRDG